MAKWNESYIRLYGDYNCTFNYHIVSRHLIEDVRAHGSIKGHNNLSVTGDRVQHLTVINE